MRKVHAPGNVSSGTAANNGRRHLEGHSSQTADPPVAHLVSYMWSAGTNAAMAVRSVGYWSCQSAITVHYVCRGWSLTADVFILGVVSDAALANLKLVRWLSTQLPNNALLLHHFCNAILG